MSCTSPLYRIPVGSRAFMCLSPYDQNRRRNKGVFLTYDALETYQNHPHWRSEDVQILRCGQCTDCRLAYSRDWAVRCSLEASLHPFNYFITLTYDDVFLPRGEFVDFSGEEYDSTLVRRDVQLFIKRLREWDRDTNGNTFKVFYCGEYGDSTSRPHYHLCVFGISELPDLRWSFRKKSFNFYKSAILERCWNDPRTKVPKGFVDVSECSFDSIAYTARYVLKKQTGLMKSDFLEVYDQIDPTCRPDLRVQPFIGMSLKPGIAAEYFSQHQDQIFLEDKVKYQKAYELFASKPPRYFDRLFERDDPDAFSLLKRRRKLAGINAGKLKTTLYSESRQNRLEREASINLANSRRYYVRN